MENKVRIIAGELKGRVIKIPKATDTRPALVLVRRMIADTLMPYIPETRVLDLFAGTGAFVFEMLSRGADSAVAVDIDKRMTQSIEENAKILNVVDRLQVLNMDFTKALELCGRQQKRFDLIFIPPPFYGDFVDRAFSGIRENNVASGDAIAVAHYHKDDKVDREPEGFRLWKTKSHGVSVMDFFIKKN
jgi:16S rRNA (guanine(966)-N(2))-methyltransferase RsmD